MPRNTTTVGADGFVQSRHNGVLGYSGTVGTYAEAEEVALRVRAGLARS